MPSKILLAAISLAAIAVYLLLSTYLTPDYVIKVSQVPNLPHIDAKMYDQVKTFLLFIGYNRSRHTLLASLLDAHPNVIIANDFNILKEWIENPLLTLRKKYYIYELLLGKSHYDVMFGVRSRPVGNKPVKYHYNVHDEWQGTFNGSIQVIGDKKAAQASGILINPEGIDSIKKLEQKLGVQVIGDKKAAQASGILINPEGIDSIKKLEQKLGVQVKFIHVIRNPFDNIATMALRRANERKKGQEILKVNYSKVLDGSISSYGRLAQGSFEVQKKFPGRVHDVASIDVMMETRKTLLKICDFLEITCTEKYLRDCASIVDPRPSQTRHNVEWTGKQIKRVQSLIAQYPFLQRYSFED